jgi:hypothetical protein
MATTAERLAEAEQVLHELAIGRSVVEIRTETETVKYTPADRERLEAYAAQLRRDLGRPRRARAVPVVFR